jgi:hypothetical protein
VASSTARSRRRGDDHERHGAKERREGAFIDHQLADPHVGDLLRQALSHAGHSAASQAH